MSNEFKAKNGLIAPYAGVVYVDLDTTATSPVAAKARMWYNSEDDTLNLGHDNGVVQQIGQEFFMPPCKNNSGVTIPNGAFVMATGAQGDKITIAKAVTNGTVAPEYMIGVATRDITSDDEFGHIITNGIVRDVNTSTWIVGTILYPDPTTAGAFTSTKPTAPSIKTPIAIVLRQNATSGRIYVRMSNGSVLGGTDSNVEFGNLVEGDLIVYNAINQRWENKQVSELAGTSGFSGYSGYSGQDGFVGESGISGYSGYSGIDGTQGELGISGYSGYSGQDGFVGADGASGFSGYSGESGYSGYSGQDGIQGESGFSGISGFSGDSGISGYSGDSGISGYSGQDGASGFSGLSGFSGYSGETGLGFTIAKTYASVASLEADTTPTGIIAGQFAIIDTGDIENPENSRLYLWNGSTYQYTSDLSGAQGIKGESGISGFSGYSGFSGISGYSGDSGYSGISGYSGESGISGYSGTSGASGQDGIQGESGISGYSGDSGFSGISGFSGQDGIQGESGISGYSGYSGQEGISGFSGYSGISGTLPSWILKNSNYTANDTDRIIADTSGGTFTITLPATPTVGSYVVITDAGDWSTNNLIVARNGSTIEGYTDDLLVTLKGVTIELIYSGTSWQVTATTGTSGASGFSGFSGYSGAAFVGSSGYSGYSGYSGITSAVVYDAGTPSTDFSVGLNINCGGVI